MSESAVIVFASQKGGSGKTTLSGHVAVEAEARGDGPVALIDTDPQGSLSKWWNAREAELPAFAHIPTGELEAGIAHLKRSGFRLIVIDTPPAVTDAIADTVRHADLVIVPTRPSPHDLRAVGPTVDIIERLQKSMIFVVNSATSRARITGETAVALSQHGVVAPVTVHHRVDFAASMIDGRTVGEAKPDGRSAGEITALWRYVRDRVARLTGLSRREEDDFSTAVLSPVTGADSAGLHEESVEASSEPEPAAAAAPRPMSLEEIQALLNGDAPSRAGPFGVSQAAPPGRRNGEAGANGHADKRRVFGRRAQKAPRSAAGDGG